MSRNDEDWRVSPMELLDQAFHLLRSLTPSQLAPSLVGPLPFILGLLFFWSDMTRAGDATTSAPGWALVLALLYFWMKAWQAHFARTVWARLLPEGGLPPLHAYDFFRRTAALCLLSAFSLPLHAMGLLLTVPMGWIYATFQNVTIFAYTQDFDERPLRELAGLSIRQSHHEALQNHVLLLLLVIFATIVFISLWLVAGLLPGMVKIFTGFENAFTLNPLAAVFNSMFIASIASVAWLVLSPFFRIAYVLRNFYALSRTTGVDLLSRLPSPRRASALTLAVVLALVAPAMGDEAPTGAPPASAPVAERDTREMTEAIRSTLSHREYQWRLPRAQPADADPTSWYERLATSVRDSLRHLDGMIHRFKDAIFGGRGGPASTAGSGGFEASALRALVFLLIAALLVVVVLVIIHVVRSRRLVEAVSPAAGAPAPVDLHDEAVLANTLPEDQWLKLAREQLAAGDFRLAVRALFLATLASLGDQRLIEIARSKSNRDYRDELVLRTRARTGLHEAFGENTGLFECVWYGLHDAGHDMVERLMTNYERIKHGQTA